MGDFVDRIISSLEPEIEHSIDETEIGKDQQVKRWTGFKVVIPGKMDELAAISDNARSKYPNASIIDVEVTYRGIAINMSYAEFLTRLGFKDSEFCGICHKKLSVGGYCLSGCALKE